MHGRIPHTAILALLALLAITPVAQAKDGRSAAKKTVSAKKTHAGVATFKVRPAVVSRSVRSARLRVGKRSRRISAKRVVRVARGPLGRVGVSGKRRPRTSVSARKLRVKLNRRERRASRRSKPRLVIFRATKAKKKPAKDPNPPVTSKPAPDENSSLPQEPPAAGDDQAGPAPTPAPGVKSAFRPAGSPVLSDAEAAARVRPSGAEIRPMNTPANNTIPTPAQLSTFRSENSSVYEPHERLVTGAFRGTTDEIIQWAAWKWGIDEDVFRAQAAVETWWDTSFIGDRGQSFGLFQIKRTVHLGTYPMSVDSTAFNADYTGALFRYYYDGHAKWLMNVEHGKTYAAGDAWGALGAHYSGRWYTTGSIEYMDKVKRRLADRVWEKSGF